jgi:hypothetical protein
MGTWNDLSKRLRESENFGQSLIRENYWLGDIEKPLLTGAKSDMEKAARIYTFVRDNFTCTAHTGLFLDHNLKTVAKSRNGNDAEINLLLTAMLNYADIKADPVILSTRSHGYTFELYPLLSRFNYVISRAFINDKPFYFDASVPRLGFGKLMSYCYNGHARVVNEEATPVFFNADSVTERKASVVFLFNSDHGGIKGSMQQFMGGFESLGVRDQIREKGQEDFIKEIQKIYGEEFKITNPVIDSLNKPDADLSIRYELSMNKPDDDIIYFNPLMGEGYKNNPFKSAERFYPVEMPYASDELFSFNMEVPTGYTVDEFPQPVRVKLNEQGDGLFEYLIQVQDGRINLRSRVIFKRTFFRPEEYENLREFYNLVVKKQNEQIVFKKKK